MECPECGNQMQLETIPRERLNLSIFGYEIQIWDFNHKELICIECMTEEAHLPEREIYEAGCQDGYLEAMQKYRQP